jgi:hypothetical protein
VIESVILSIARNYDKLQMMFEWDVDKPPIWVMVLSGVLQVHIQMAS